MDGSLHNLIDRFPEWQPTDTLVITIVLETLLVTHRLSHCCVNQEEAGEAPGNQEPDPLPSIAKCTKESAGRTQSADSSSNTSIQGATWCSHQVLSSFEP